MSSVVKYLIRTFLFVSKLEYLDVLFWENDPYKREITCQTLKVYTVNMYKFIYLTENTLEFVKKPMK
jgi:hypothetical protein